MMPHQNEHTVDLENHALIQQAQTGDERAFTKLVKQYEQLVYGFAFKVCRDQEKAEETWQDTFVNVYRKLDQFDGKSKFTTWLYSIVTNNCRMKHRKTKLALATIHFDEPAGIAHKDNHRHNDGEDGTLIQTIPSWRETPLESMVSKELKHHLDKAIQQLPLDYRVVFVLRDIEGQSAEETAKILKLSIPAVKSRLRRARMFLREHLNEYMAV
jgi:RNA polymerase sigma-70 factor, ECF subfamily